MVAGDIIIPDNTITPELLDKIAAEVQNRLSSTSKDPGQYEEVDSLTGITSIPVFQQSGSTYKLVRVLLSILKGDSAYQVWVNEPGNAGKTLSDFFLSIKGAKGDPFTFADFTPEQLADLALSYEKLTPEQKEEMKLKFGDLTEADMLVLQKPATEAAAEVRKEMAQISQEASAAIKAATDAADNAQDAADNVQDGKTTQFEIGTVESGAAPSASLTDNGVDAIGNPKKKLNLVMQKGDNAKSPTVQTGTITTGDPASEVAFTFTEAGMTEDGRPIWRVDGVIPRGQQGPPGTGSGNVSADGTGLVIGKKYLFVPSSDDSTAGTFVEYVAPEIPEQVQPDWNATEGKGAILNKPTIPAEQVNSDWNATEGKAAILHKPGDATADTSGLMSAAQFQKLQKLNPSSLSNDVTGKKVEYTDAGKLLFEDKETFAVDADNELTLAGKKLSELGGGSQYLDLSPLLDAETGPVATVSNEVLSKIDEAYNKKYTSAFAAWAGNAVMPMSMEYREDENAYSIVLSVTTTEGNDLLCFAYNLIISKTDKSLNFIPKGIQLRASGDGVKALMDDGTYKIVGGNYQLLAATDSALGGIKTGYTTSGKNYPVKLDGSNKAYVNVPWTDTTYTPATTSSNGLMSSADKKKLDRIGSYTTATTVANLDANYENIEISNLSANASLSVNLVGTTYNGWDINVFIYCSSARTVTIPTTGSYVSMIGSSLTCPAGKYTELNLHCAGGKWHIAKLEQE